MAILNLKITDPDPTPADSCELVLKGLSQLVSLLPCYNIARAHALVTPSAPPVPRHWCNLVPQLEALKKDLKGCYSLRELAEICPEIGKYTNRGIGSALKAAGIESSTKSIDGKACRVYYF